MMALLLRTVDSLCAMTKTVRPSMSLSIPCWTIISVRVSMLLVAVIRKDNPLSRKHSLDADDLDSQPLVISNPHTCPPSVDDLQHRMIQEHSTKNIILADSIEGVSVLAEAGFGIGLIPGPALAEGQSVRCIPVKNSSVLSYGIYHSRTCEKEEAMAFIQMMKSCFSPS